MWPVLLLVAAGAAFAGWVAADERAQREIAKATRAAKAKAEKLRLPKPDYAMTLPSDEEDFRLLDELVAKCVASLPDPQPGETMGPQIEAARDCVLKQLYADFPWPPVTGDHPTAGELYGMVEYEVVKKLVTL